MQLSRSLLALVRYPLTVMADDVHASVDDEESSSKTMHLFGRDLSTIPCFRKTFLTSISSGLASGLTYFMFTSKVRQAGHVAYGTFFVVTIGYWMYCRYRWAYDAHYVRQMMTAAESLGMLEGTEADIDAKQSD